MVFDASYKQNKRTPSLNDCLMQGPCSLPEITILITGFRMHAIGISADKEKAFLQIQIDPTDRDAPRLWIDEEDRLIIYRHRWHNVFGLTCSPAILQRVIQEHLHKFIIQKLRKSIFIDNLITRCSSYTEALELYDIPHQVFALAGFNWHWYANSVELEKDISHSDNNDIDSSNECQGVQGDNFNFLESTLDQEILPLKCKEAVSILGIPWYFKDSFHFSCSHLKCSEKVPVTKRTICKKHLDSMTQWVIYHLLLLYQS